MNSWAQYYKTFFACSLQIFVMCQSVCHWQAFTAQSYKHSSSVQKFVNHGQKSFMTLAPGLPATMTTAPVS